MFEIHDDQQFLHQVNFNSESLSRSRILKGITHEFGLMSALTVSYTHLDVYKRQVQHCVTCCCVGVLDCTIAYISVVSLIA